VVTIFTLYSQLLQVPHCAIANALQSRFYMGSSIYSLKLFQSSIKQRGDGRVGPLAACYGPFALMYLIEGNAGLPFAALIIGFMLSVPVTILCGRPYKRALQLNGKAEPELRLIFAMISAVLVGEQLPISC
jgi:hypothetical protein